MRRVASVVVAVVLVGCANGDEPAADPATEASEEQAEAEVDGDGAVVDDLDEGADDGPPATGRPAGEPLVVTEHPTAGHDGALEIELRAEVVGELLRAAVTFIPRGIGDERTSLAELFGSMGSGNGISARLIDPVNLLEYETVRPAVSHGQSTPVHDGQPLTLHFYFAAPVEDLETFDFLLDFVVGVPDWPGFVDVPFGTS
jgi:hypothetical protein